MKQTKKISVIMIAAWIASTALSETVTVNQVDKAFSTTNLTIKTGDKVKFVNGDKIKHHIFSTSEGHNFILGVQDPGAQNEHTFDKPTGDKPLEVRCAIHPNMKLTIKVEDKK